MGRSFHTVALTLSSSNDAMSPGKLTEASFDSRLCSCLAERRQWVTVGDEAGRRASGRCPRKRQGQREKGQGTKWGGTMWLGWNVLRLSLDTTTFS